MDKNSLEVTLLSPPTTDRFAHQQTTHKKRRADGSHQR